MLLLTWNFSAKILSQRKRSGPHVCRHRRRHFHADRPLWTEHMRLSLFPPKISLKSKLKDKTESYKEKKKKGRRIKGEDKDQKLWELTSREKGSQWLGTGQEGKCWRLQTSIPGSSKQTGTQSSRIASEQRRASTTVNRIGHKHKKQASKTPS